MPIPSRTAAVFLLVVVGFALASVVFFSPSVSVRELQRKDRLSEQGQFVDQAYRYLLGRAADAAGLAEYASRYERSGPESVVTAIVSSREFQDRHPDGTLFIAATNSDEGISTTDAGSFARKYVDLYQAGSLIPRPTGDWEGRVGFVLLLALSAIAIIAFQRASRRPPSRDGLYAYLPRAHVVTLFSVLAVVWWLNSQVLFYSFVPGSLGYAEWLDKVTNLSISRGVTGVWTPYPQGTQMLLVVLESFAIGVADWLHSDVWSSYTIFRCLFQALFLLVPSIAVVTVVYSIGAMISPRTATLASTVVAFSFAPIYYGVASTLVTDPLPVMLAITGIWFCALKKPAWAALAVSLGAALKLIPVVLLVPALVLATNYRSRLRMLLIASAVLGCIFLPFLLANSEIFWSPFRWQSGRPAWQSWYAFFNWLVGAPHDFTSLAFEDLGFRHDFGWVFWGITPPLTSLITAVPSNPVRWDNIVSVIGTVLSLLAVLSARSSGPRALARWSMYALAVTLFWSIGWSPQYELYIVPLAALSFEAPLAVLGAALGLELLTFLEYPLFLPWAYFYGGSAVWLAWGATVSRYLLLGWLAVFVVRSEGNASMLRCRLERMLRIAMSPRSWLAGMARAGIALGVAVTVAGCASPNPPVPNPPPAPTAAPAPQRAAGPPPAAAAPAVAAAPAPADQTANACGPTRFVNPHAAGSTPETDWALPGGWFFTQAGSSVDNNQGYGIVDDGEAQLWSEFQWLGGWRAIGFPASRRFKWHGSLSQATQRAVLQWSPVTGQVEFANVLDLMHDGNRDEDLRALKQIPPPLDVDEAGLPYEVIAARRLAWLDARPAIKSKYCAAPGGADPIQLWGLPTSKAINMSDVGEVYVLRTQRAAFQEWVNGADWAAPGEVTVVLAGDLAKEFKLLPADALLPEPATSHT